MGRSCTGERHGRGELSASSSRAVGCAATVCAAEDCCRERLRRDWGRSERCVNENEGETGGGGGGGVNGALWQLKGPLVAEEPQRVKFLLLGQSFRHWSENSTLHHHLSCKIKTKIK